MLGGATGPITKAISQRRSHRRHWRTFECISMIILDALLITIAFYLAYFLRYVVLGNNPVLNAIHNNLFENPGGKVRFTPVGLESFTSLEICIVVGLIAILAMRRLYTIRLTGSWFRQAWTIIVS